MTHYTTRDDDVPPWPIGSSIVVKFADHGEEGDYVARAAMIQVTSELKERIEKAADALNADKELRTVQFYWPIDVVTNEVYGQPIPKPHAPAIKELLDADFQQAIPDEVASNAIRRVASPGSITWISVGRPCFGTGSGRVEVGCTQMLVFDFIAGTDAIPSSTPVSGYSREATDAESPIRAIEDLSEWSAPRETP